MERQRLAQVLVQSAAVARLAYPRGRFEGLQANVVQVALALSVRPDETVTRLSALLALNYTTVSHAVAALEDQGLVLGRRPPHDHRSRDLRLTPAGRRFVQRFLDSRSDELAMRLKGRRSR